MIELQNDQLVFAFPEVHASASVTIEFQRTLRIPDDDRTYPLPPGLGRFPVRHVDDHAGRVPGGWLEHGGVMLPMYQAEAMWLRFDGTYDDARRVEYPFAIKIAAGKVNAVTGQSWSNALHRRPQDYVVTPKQPWLDGYCVEKGVIRQFVAMPLGQGYTAEEQLTGVAEHGGLQIVVYPMKREVYERRFRVRKARSVMDRTLDRLACAPVKTLDSSMGLAPGGRMKQEIYDDPYELDDWDLAHASRCFVHIANSQVWQSITGQKPPTRPPTAQDYTRAGLPWFEYYGESPAVAGSDVLKGLTSVAAMGQQKDEVPFGENNPVTPANVVKLRAGLGRDQVREGAF